MGPRYLQIQKGLFPQIHNIYKQIYSDNEGNEADAYLSVSGECDQPITLAMAYSL